VRQFVAQRNLRATGEKKELGLTHSQATICPCVLKPSLAVEIDQEIRAKTTDLPGTGGESSPCAT